MMKAVVVAPVGVLAGPVVVVPFGPAVVPFRLTAAVVVTALPAATAKVPAAAGLKVVWSGIPYAFIRCSYS